MQYVVSFEESKIEGFSHAARTLAVSCVSEDDSVETGYHSRTHENGWTVSGQVQEDYFTWVNDFEAHHPIFGKVWGNFEVEVFAESEAGFLAFTEEFPVNEWDYFDI